MGRHLRRDCRTGDRIHGSRRRPCRVRAPRHRTSPASRGSGATAADGRRQRPARRGHRLRRAARGPRAPRHGGEPLPLVRSRAVREGIGPFKPRGEPSGVVLRGGYVIASWGEPDRVDMTHSVTKSFLSATVGLAFDRGLIRFEFATRSGSRRRRRTPCGSKRRPNRARAIARRCSSTRGARRTIAPSRGTTCCGRPATGKGRCGASPNGPTVRRRTRRSGPRARGMAPGTVYEYNDVRVNVLALAATNLWRRPLPEVARRTGAGPHRRVALVALVRLRQCVDHARRPSRRRS